jgi:glycine cleavage system H protein
VSDTLFYKRATFVAHLPVGHRYTSSHTWLAPAPHHPDTWHVGLTKFALRMLGELVEHRLETPPGHPVQPGDILGSIEGFKAISDLFCVASGTFLGGNPALANGLEPLGRDVHRVWLYAVRGTPDPRSLDLHGYVGVLDATIDRILEKQAAEDADETASGAACPLPPHA